VTSGLDPKAEDEINPPDAWDRPPEKRIVLSVTHSLRHLALYDSVVVLYRADSRTTGRRITCITISTWSIRRNFPRLPSAKRKSGISLAKACGTYYAQIKVDPMAAADAAALEEVSDKPAPEDNEAHPQFQQLPSAADGDKVDKVELPAESDSREANVAAGESHKATAPAEKHDFIHPGIPSPFTQFSVMLARRWKIFFRDRGNLVLQIALLVGFPFWS